MLWTHENESKMNGLHLNPEPAWVERLGTKTLFELVDTVSLYRAILNWTHENE